VKRKDFINKRRYKTQKVNWLVVGIISIVVLLLLFGGGMMNNWGYASSPSTLGWIGMIFMWLIPVGLVVLTAFGLVWLVRNVGNSEPPSS
jgi:uncharacterized membrane protein